MLCKLGHMQLECKSVEPLCFNCRHTWHMSGQCINPKVYPSGRGKKTGAPKVQERAFQMIVEEATHDDEVFS